MCMHVKELSHAPGEHAKQHHAVYPTTGLYLLEFKCQAPLSALGHDNDSTRKYPSSDRKALGCRLHQVLHFFPLQLSPQRLFKVVFK